MKDLLEKHLFKHENTFKFQCFSISFCETSCLFKTLKRSISSFWICETFFLINFREQFQVSTMGSKIEFCASFVFAVALSYLITFSYNQFKNTASFKGLENEKLDKKLYDEVQILCWMFTSPQDYRIKNKIMSKTWGKRCNIFVSLSAANNPVEETVVLKVNRKDEVWSKTREVFKYASCLQNLIETPRFD